MRIWPAIDLFQGKVVRLTKGDFATRTEYAEDPFAVAEDFLSGGCPRLHIVDLEGAKAGRPLHAGLLPALASLGLSIRYGGGLRSEEDIARVLSQGASSVMVGSLLFSTPLKPGELFNHFGNRIIPAVDVNEGRVAIHGWTKDLPLEPAEVLGNLFSSGFMQSLVTAVERDGTGNGPDLLLYRKLRELVPGMNLTAAGGIASQRDLLELKKLGVSDAVVGKALYERKLTIKKALEVEDPC